MEEEVKMLQAAQTSGCVPKLIDTFNFKNKFVIIMELCEGETLGDLLTRSRPLKRTMHRIIAGIFDAILRLHSIAGVIHNDIKFDNILVKMRGKECEIRLIDLGHSKFAGEEVFSDMSEEKISDFPHFDPALALRGRCSDRTDFYSFGYLLQQIAELYDCPVYEYMGEELCSGRLNEIEEDCFLASYCSKCAFQ